MLKKELLMIRRIVRQRLRESILNSNALNLLIESKVDDAIDRYIPFFVDAKGNQVSKQTLETIVLKKFDNILTSFKKDNKRYLFIPVVLSALTKGGTTNFVIDQNAAKSFAELNDLEMSFACAIRKDNLITYEQLVNAAQQGVQSFYLFVVSKVGRIEPRGGQTIPLCLPGEDLQAGYRNVPTYQPKSFNYQDVYRSKYKKISQKEKGRRQQSKIVYDDDNLMVVRPETVVASCFYGQQGKWCLSKPGGTLFQSYEENDKKHFYFVKNFADDTDTSDIVLQFDKGSGTLDIIWDRNDNPRRFREYAPKDFNPFVKGTTIASFIYKIYSFVASSLNPTTNRESILKMCLAILNEYVQDRRFDFSQPDIDAFLATTATASSIETMEKQYAEDQSRLIADEIKRNQEIIAKRIPTFKKQIDKIVDYFKQSNISYSDLMTIITEKSMFYTQILPEVCRKLNINKKSNDDLRNEARDILVKILQNNNKFDALMMGFAEKLIDISLENNSIDGSVIQQNQDLISQIADWALNNYGNVIQGFNILYAGIAIDLNDDSLRNNASIIKEVLLQQGTQISEKYDDMLNFIKESMDNYKNIPEYNIDKREQITVNGSYVKFEGVVSQKLINTPGVISESFMIDKINNRMISDIVKVVETGQLWSPLTETLWSMNRNQNLIPFGVDQSLRSNEDLKFYFFVETNVMALEDNPVFSFSCILSVKEFNIEFDIFPQGSQWNIYEDLTDEPYLEYPFEHLFEHTGEYHLSDTDAERMFEDVEDNAGFEPGNDIYYAAAMSEITDLFLPFFEYTDKNNPMITTTEIAESFIDFELEENLFMTRDGGRDELKNQFARFAEDYLINDGKSFRYQISGGYKNGQQMSSELFTDPSFSPNNFDFSGIDNISIVKEEMTKVIEMIEASINTRLPEFQKNMEIIFEETPEEWANKKIKEAIEEGWL